MPSTDDLFTEMARATQRTVRREISAALDSYARSNQRQATQRGGSPVPVVVNGAMNSDGTGFTTRWHFGQALDGTPLGGS